MSSTEPDYQFRSDPISGPIEELSALRRSLLLGELAYIAYLDEDSAQSTVEPLRLVETLFIDQDGAQAYVFRTKHDCILAIRGTEPDEWSDVRADINATWAVAETVGRVHRGFKDEVDRLWPLLEPELMNNARKLWITGHSLGGAMATICAAKCHQVKFAELPVELHTFGSPRVGNRQYLNHVKLKHYRWVVNNDIVARVPPIWMGYRHGGKLMYIDSRGRFGRLSRLHYAQDCWRGFWNGMKKFEIDFLADHSMNAYLDGIEYGIRREEARKKRKSTS